MDTFGCLIAALIGVWAVIVTGQYYAATARVRHLERLLEVERGINVEHEEPR